MILTCIYCRYSSDRSNRKPCHMTATPDNLHYLKVTQRPLIGHNTNIKRTRHIFTKAMGQIMAVHGQKSTEMNYDLRHYRLILPKSPSLYVALNNPLII